jgi:transglutaminase-like putative cysteine protease
MSMTASSDRRIPLAPSEGWLTLGLVLLLCASLAWALDDSMLVLGRDAATDFLLWTAVAGVLAGFAGAKVGWGRMQTYLVGAAFAALITPLLVGWVLIPDGAPLHDLYEASAAAGFGAWRDLIWRGNLSTPQFGHHLLVLGLIVWGSSMFASYAAFGHRRPLNAILLVGVLLVANMAFTARDQLVFLVTYSLAALFLLIRFHTFEEQSEWVRRRIGDPSAISGLYLRGGTVFIVAMVAGSLLLTNVAQSAPLAGAWTNIGGRVVEWGQFLQRYLPVSGSGRSLGQAFGNEARVTGVWSADETPALILRTGDLEADAPYLVGADYDDFKLGGWAIGETDGVDRASDDVLLAETEDELHADGWRETTVTITPSTAYSVVVAPESPVSVTTPTSVQLLRESGFMASLQRPASASTYDVTVLVPAAEDDGGITENKLRAAGQDYPAGMLEEYGQAAVPDGTFSTPEARALLAEMVPSAGLNPFDIAQTMVTTLQDGERFRYDADVRDFACESASVVDCFAVHKRGYCEYYASTMVMMLRALDIPARLVQGYKPGTPDPATGEIVVRNSDRHAWVQVYFPGYGWWHFDPTGGGQAALPALPTGAPVASASTGPSSSSSSGPRPDESFRDIDDGPGGSVFGGTSSGGGGPGPFIAIGLLLATVIAVLASVAWRRGPRGPVTADDAYRMVTRLATRLGFGPHPNQTVYEYAGVLAEILPGSRPELETVATAKVEVAYGGRALGTDQIAALREARRRLRTSLLRLAMFRLPRRLRPKP